MLTSEHIQADNTYHHNLYDLSTYELVLQRDLSNTKVRTNEEVKLYCFSCLGEHVRTQESVQNWEWYARNREKEECLANTVLG